MVPQSKWCRDCSAYRITKNVLSLKQTKDVMPDHCCNNFIGCPRKSIVIQNHITDLQGAIHFNDIVLDVDCYSFFVRSAINRLFLERKLSLLGVLFMSLHLRFGTISHLMYNPVNQFMFLNLDSKLLFLIGASNRVNERDVIHHPSLRPC